MAFLLPSCGGMQVHLSTEKYEVELAMGWVLALQHASLGPDGAQGGCRRSVAGHRDLYPRGRPRPAGGLALSGISEDAPEATESGDASAVDPDATRAGPAAPKAGQDAPNAGQDVTVPPEAVAYWKEREANADQEIDGTKIDDARWAALRKGWIRDQGMDSETADDAIDLDDEDEDVRAMRDMEEEEERRQEEERLAFLAEREKGKLAAATSVAAAVATADAAAVAADQASVAAAADATADSAQHDASLDDDDGTQGEQNFSEDEADWFSEMQAQEEAETARQERERLEWLDSKEGGGDTA